MSKKTTMFELLNERMEKEDILKLVFNYDNQFNELEENNKQLKSQLQQKENIIKEVREYIEEELKSGRSKDNQWLMGCYDEDKKILQILDKV